MKPHRAGEFKRLTVRFFKLATSALGTDATFARQYSLPE
jgi:hypothetical protein